MKPLPFPAAPRPQFKLTPLFASLVVAIAPLPLEALDGGNDVFITVPTGENLGWKTFEILTGDDALGARAKEGFVWTTTKHDDWDGVGAYRHDASTLRVFINHEAGANSTFSRVDLDMGNLQTWIVNGNANNNNSNQVAAPGQIVTDVSRGWLTVGSGTNPINNPCSGNVWMADTFGPGRGFADTLYLTGEETFNTSGQYWVMDVSTRTLYECPALGGGSWENACIIDTGRTDTVALLLGEDAGSSASGTAPLRLYVGAKNPGGNFLQRNGLASGTVYYWDPAGGSTNGTISGIFSGGTGAKVSGTWVTGSGGAAQLSKLEDVHTNVNPSSAGYGVEVAVASQGEAVFVVDFSQVDFVAGNLGTNRDSEVLVLVQSGTYSGNNFTGMDNLVWSPDGCIYVNEDDGEGDIWKIDVDSLLASFAVSDFTPSASEVVDILDADFVSESSGIIDISEHVGYEPGGVFLTAGQSGTLANNQLAMLVAPGATLITYNLAYAAGAGGSLTGSTNQVVAAGADGTTVTAVPDLGYAFDEWSDGVSAAARTDTSVMADLSVTANFVVESEYQVWMTAYPSITGADRNPGMDPDGDGAINAWEFASNLDPTVPDATALTAGISTAGLPLIEVRKIGTPGTDFLVIEYLRRIGDPDLTYLPEFKADLGSPDPWAVSGIETVTPIDATWERVVAQDFGPVAAAQMGFARLGINLVVP